jgi:hypothetical protein
MNLHHIYQDILTFTKGIFKKRLVSLEEITNYQIKITNYEGEPSQLGSYSLPLLEIDDVVVMNSCRVSDGQYTSYYTRGGNVRAGGGRIGGRSHTVGDVHFVRNNGMDFVFRNVPDPKGLASLVKSLRKSLMQIEKRKQV